MDDKIIFRVWITSDDLNISDREDSRKHWSYLEKFQEILKEDKELHDDISILKVLLTNFI